MSEVMTLMMNERDFGEELTSFQSDEDEDDEDDEDIDLDDDDDDEDMYMLYEEEPPCYDVVARLKELNEALKNEIIPADYEERSRKVQFKENPIFLEIYTSTGFTDDEEEEDNEEDVDDDGYGDSTEVSDEVNEEHGSSAAQRASQRVVTTVHELAKLREEEKRREEEERAKRAQEILEADAVDTPANVDQEKDDSLISEIERKLALDSDEKPIELVVPEISVEKSESILPQETESVLPEIRIESSVSNNVQNNEEGGLTNDNNVLLSSTETLDAADAEISPVVVVTLDVSSSGEKCDVPVPETGSGESFLNQSNKPAQNGSKHVPDSRRNSARKSTSAGSNNKSIKLRPRSSSVPPRMSNGNNADSMIMASKGKFHVMTTDDIQVRKSLGSAQETRKNARSSALQRTPSKSAAATPRRRQQSAIHKSDSSSVKVSSGSETSSINGSSKSPPSFKDASPTPKIMPKYAGEGPSKYGLTTAQKMEKKLNCKLILENVEGKKQVSEAEKARKREQMDEAYRIWLQRKKLHAKYKSSAPLKDSKNSSQNSSQNKVNGESHDKRKSGPAFDDWLVMKKVQKKKNLEIERMKKKVEMEISYVKTNEQNRKSFHSWSKQKQRNSPSLN